MNKNKTKTIVADDVTKNAFKAWNLKSNIKDFVTEKLGVIDKQSGKSHADSLVDSMISKAKSEDLPNWTALLFKTIEPPKNQNVSTNINLFSSIATASNEGVDSLINVTPKNKSIKDII